MGEGDEGGPELVERIKYELDLEQMRTDYCQLIAAVITRGKEDMSAETFCQRLRESKFNGIPTFGEMVHSSKGLKSGDPDRVVAGQPSGVVETFDRIGAEVTRLFLLNELTFEEARKFLEEARKLL